MFKKTLVMVSALAVILSVSVTAFAFSPDKQSYLPDVGGWQIGTQNATNLYQWNYEACPTCGTYGYWLEDKSSTPYYESVQMGDVFAVADATDSTADTVNDSGTVAYFTAEDPHEATAHRVGLFVLTTYGEVFTTLPKNTAEFRGIIGGFHRVTPDGGISPSWERVESVYRTNCTTRNTCTYYATSTFAVPLYNNEMELYIQTLEQNAYNIGLANGVDNADIIAGVDGILNGIISGFNPILTYEVMGVSIVSICALFVSFAIIMLLVKVIRG